MSRPAPCPDLFHEPEGQPPLIALVRLAALSCRAGRRGPAPACAAIDPDAPVEDLIVALAKALPEALHRRPVIWRPGAAGRSFDEDWLLALAAALRAADADSVRFLLGRRVRPVAGPMLRSLVRRLDARLHAVETAALETAHAAD